MKKRITFLLAALLLLSGLSWAQQITWSAADQGYENGAVIESIDFNDYVAGEFFKGTNNNPPKYYTTGAAIRCYGGNYFTITSDYVLTEISFGFASGEGSNAITSDVGTYEDGTWTGSANEVTFTIAGTSGHRRFASFTITYDEGGNPAPSISASNVEIAYDATEGAIEYTITNGVDGGVLSAETEAEWLEIGEVGETVPFTCSVNDDGERTATVTLTYTYDSDQTVTKNVTVTQANNPNAPGTENNPYTVAQARAAIDAGTGTQGVYATGIVSGIVNEWNTQYNNISFNISDDGLTTSDQLQAFRCVSTTNANASEVVAGDVVIVYGNLTLYNNSVYEFTAGCQLVSLEHPVVTEPSITVTPSTLNAPFTGSDGTLTVTYQNITEVAAEVYFCDANGEVAQYDWMVAEINTDNNVDYIIEANEGEARTAYLKVWAYDDDTNEVYSNLVTVNQEAYVAPTYAALTFEFNGGKADIEGTDGLYQQGLGSDYSSAPKLKFDDTGDYLLLQFLEEPDTLAFDIKGNSFSGGTFTVQVSADGETYTDWAIYTELGSVQHDKYAIDSDVRYIKWVYTNKSNGNVGLGNITLTKPEEAPAVVTVSPDMVTVPYTGGTDNFTLTIENIDNGNGGSVRFFDPANPEMPLDEDPTWIELGTNFDELTLYYVVNEANNSYESRTACFKYIVYRTEDTPVLSNLVTVTQNGKPLPTVAVDPYVTELETPDYAEGSLAIMAENLDINAAQINYYELVENEFVLVEEAPAWLGLQVNQDDYSVINYYVETNTGDARTAYFKLGLQSYPDMQYYYSEMVTISQAAYVAPEPPTAGWVLTNLSDLTANDIFVIVGTTSGGDSYAMSNDNGIGSAPAAVEVTVADEGTHLTGDIADNIKWNISGSANDGYTFYPNGDTESWLYCTATNNGVRVGTNDNNTFSLSDEGYLNNDATGCYVGIYNSSDWRCYTSINSNITGQTFAFYKKVGDEPQPVVASITIDPDFLTVDAGMHYGDDFLPLTYENIIVENAQSFGLQFYTAEGEETGMPTWFYAMVTPQTGSDAYQVTVATMPNDGDARSTYFKVYAYDADSTLVYSNLATVTQDAPVYDYAVLPFVWEGGSSADFAALNGVTLSGNGSDYASNHAPYLIKFDSDGDFIMVKTDSQPGTVTIGVKMIGGGNTSTITVQGSADGETFTDIEVLTISGAQNDILTLETTNAFGDNDRYVKLLFTKGSNVGVGPITITKGTAPSITLNPDTFDLDAVGPLNGMHLPTATVTYHNFEITQASDFHVQFYNAEGEEQEMPTWLLHTEVSGPITDSSSYQSIYQSISIVTANEGPARSAYYRVYAFDADSIPVYSNLVTYNQAAGAYITVNPDVVNVDAAEHDGTLDIAYENLTITSMEDFDIQYYDAEGAELEENPEWIEVLVAEQDPAVGEGYVVSYSMLENEGEARTAYFKVYAMDAESNLVYSNLITINQEAYVAPSSDENYVLFSGDLVEGDYVIYYNGYAMKNVVENSRLSYSTVTPTEDVITNPASDIVWHIAPYGEYWTIYNAELDQFAASTGAKNKAQLMESGSDDKALWTVTVSEGTYEFVNKKNSDNNVNANLRNNGGYGFACYASTTGGALSLYKCSTPVSTFTKEITGYGDNEGGYYLIASPVVATAPSADNGFLTTAYDLYKFDQTKVGEEWYNYETNAFNLTAGKGYLYASQESTTLTFMGIPYSGDGIIQLSFNADHTWGDENYYWNLVGNPFGDTAYIDRPFYAMNETGTEIMSTASQGAVAAMQGVFVLATEDGETLTFTTEEAPVAAANVTLNLSQNRGAVIDRTIVRFGEGRQLPKFQLNTESTKLYIPQGNNDYAVVRSAAYGEMPVNFKAQNNGSYTISVNAENAEANYLHLIDNMTGNDIDLLATPSYSFEAKTTDYASRFRLVFNITGVEENTNSTEPFAFFNGSEWVISNIGKATLQMVDLTGRILSSESISGNATVSTANLSTGIYLMRLVNGDNVKTQKIVVK